MGERVPVGRRRRDDGARLQRRIQAVHELGVGAARGVAENLHLEVCADDGRRLEQPEVRWGHSAQAASEQVLHAARNSEPVAPVAGSRTSSSMKNGLPAVRACTAAISSACCSRPATAATIDPTERSSRPRSSISDRTRSRLASASAPEERMVRLDLGVVGR